MITPSITRRVGLGSQGAHEDPIGSVGNSTSPSGFRPAPHAGQCAQPPGDSVQEWALTAVSAIAGLCLRWLCGMHIHKPLSPAAARRADVVCLVPIKVIGVGHLTL